MNHYMVHRDQLLEDLAHDILALMLSKGRVNLKRIKVEFFNYEEKEPVLTCDLGTALRVFADDEDVFEGDNVIFKREREDIRGCIRLDASLEVIEFRMRSRIANDIYELLGDGVPRTAKTIAEQLDCHVVTVRVAMNDNMTMFRVAENQRLNGTKPAAFWTLKSFL